MKTFRWVLLALGWIACFTFDRIEVVVPLGLMVSVFTGVATGRAIVNTIEERWF